MIFFCWANSKRHDVTNDDVIRYIYGVIYIWIGDFCCLPRLAISWSFVYRNIRNAFDGHVYTIHKQVIYKHERRHHTRAETCDRNWNGVSEKERHTHTHNTNLSAPFLLYIWHANVIEERESRVRLTCLFLLFFCVSRQYQKLNDAKKNYRIKWLLLFWLVPRFGWVGSLYVPKPYGRFTRQKKWRTHLDNHETTRYTKKKHSCWCCKKNGKKRKNVTHEMFKSFDVLDCAQYAYKKKRLGDIVLVEFPI